MDREFLGTRWQGQDEVYSERMEEPSFTVLRHGNRLTFTHDLGGHLSWEMGTEFKRSNVLDFASGAEEPGDNLDVSTLFAGISRDTRDHRMDTHEGQYSRFTVEWADRTIASDLDFLRYRFQHAVYYPLLPSVVATARGRAGILVPSGGTREIPIQERFFLGGEKSVRSYDEGEVGPRSPDGKPLGGEAFLLFSQELRFRLYEDLYGLAFADEGNVQAAYEDFGISDMAYGVGPGLYYFTPVGPVGLTVAFNPEAGRWGDDYQVLFSFGFTF